MINDNVLTCKMFRKDPKGVVTVYAVTGKFDVEYER